MRSVINWSDQLKDRDGNQLWLVSYANQVIKG